MSEEGLAIGDRGLRSYAIAFAITQLVEVPIYLTALKRSAAGPPRTALRRAAIAFGASALTHPIVWFAMPAATLWICESFERAGGPALSLAWRTMVYGALAEGFAVLAEAFYLRRFAVRRALWWSIGANAASVLVGTAVVRLLG